MVLEPTSELEDGGSRRNSALEILKGVVHGETDRAAASTVENDIKSTSVGGHRVKCNVS